MPEYLHFNQPRLAIIACIFAFICVMAAFVPLDHVEKFGALLATGAGIMYFTAAARGLKDGNGNLAVLLVGLSATMLLAGIFLTPASVWASSALENFVGHIIGGGGGLLISGGNSDKD